MAGSLAANDWYGNGNCSLAARPSPLQTLQPLAHSGDDSRRVLVINLPQHFVRQIDAIDVPQSLRRKRLLRVGKILVLGFQKPPVQPHPLLGPRSVGAKQHAVLIADQELAGRKRLASQLRDPRRNFDMEVGTSV